MKVFDYVLFDLGKTLIYFDHQWPIVYKDSAKELVRVLHHLGYPVPKDVFPGYLWERFNEYYRERNVNLIETTTDIVLRDLLAEMGMESIPHKDTRTALAAFYAVSQSHWRLEEDTLVTLETLKEEGYRLGLVSNAGNAEDVQTLVDQHGLRSYFDTIVVSASVGLRKPHPAIFRAALDHWQATPDRAVMIGDLLGADILGAHQLGMAGVWITRRADNEQDKRLLCKVKPDATIASLAELPALLRGWNRPRPV